MLQNLLVKVYFQLYGWYIYLRWLFFRIVKNITFVYYVNPQTLKKTNITWRYYTGIGLSKYCRGMYYGIIYNESTVNYIIFTGSISEISNFKLGTVQPKRKQVILLNNDIPINIDLTVLDNYQMAAMTFEKSCTNLSQILQLMNIKCTNVVIVKNRPFSRNIMSVQNLDINDLFY